MELDIKMQQYLKIMKSIMTSSIMALQIFIVPKFCVEVEKCCNDPLFSLLVDSVFTLMLAYKNFFFLLWGWGGVGVYERAKVFWPRF